MHFHSVVTTIYAAATLTASLASAQAPTVTVDNGVFVGVSSSVPGATQSVKAFLGVPFAVTPPQRFSPPVKPPNSNVVRQATQFRSNCIQTGPGKQIFRVSVSSPQQHSLPPPPPPPHPIPLPVPPGFRSRTSVAYSAGAGTGLGISWSHPCSRNTRHFAQKAEGSLGNNSLFTNLVQVVHQRPTRHCRRIVKTACTLMFGHQRVRLPQVAGQSCELSRRHVISCGI